MFFLVLIVALLPVNGVLCVFWPRIAWRWKLFGSR